MYGDLQGKSIEEGSYAWRGGKLPKIAKSLADVDT